MENRNGLAVDAALTHATGTAEREATLLMLDCRERRRRRITLGAVKAYDVTGNSSARCGRAGSRRTWPCRAALCEGNAAQDRDRRPYASPSGLRGEPAYPQAHRGDVRLDQGAGRSRTGEGAWTTKGRGRVHLRRRRLQFDPHSKLLAPCPARSTA